MDFIITLCAALIFFSCGTAFSCLIKILKRKLSLQNKKPFDFTLFCLALSFALVSFSCALIYIACAKVKFSLGLYDFIFLLGVFFAGLLIFLFPKIFLPLALLLYAGLTFASYKIIRNQYTFFAPTKTVTLQKNTVLVEKEEYKISFDENNFPSLLVEECTLPAKLLVPLPRTFYKVKGVSSLLENKSAAGSANVEEEKSLEKKIDLVKQKNILSAYIFSDKKLLEIPLKKQNVLPVVYSLRADRSLGKMYFDIKIIF